MTLTKASFRRAIHQKSTAANAAMPNVCGETEIRKFHLHPFRDPCFNGFYCVFLQTKVNGLNHFWDIFGIFLTFRRGCNMKIKRSTAFSLFAYGKDKKKYQIRFRVTFNSQRIDLSTGCQISSLEWWDPNSEAVKAGYKGPKGETDISINNELRKQKDQMEMTFNFFEFNDLFPNGSLGLCPKNQSQSPRRVNRNPKRCHSGNGLTNSVQRQEKRMHGHPRHSRK